MSLIYDEEFGMEVVGIIATAAAGVVVVGVVVLSVLSIPDIRRYLKMRSM